MIQKKVCMVGVFGVGKTSLVQQYVHSRFTAKYHSTVGVKIDRRDVDVDGDAVTLVLWDIAGKDADEDIPPSYVRGSHGVIFVVDMTRRETWNELPALRALITGTAGEVPMVVALNKADIPEQWKMRPDEETALNATWDVVRTSAKTGEGVEELFLRVARGVLGKPGATP